MRPPPSPRTAASPTSRVAASRNFSPTFGRNQRKDGKSKGLAAADLEQMLTKAQARHEALQTGFTDRLHNAMSQDLLREVLTSWYESTIWIRSAINSLGGAADMMFTRHAKRRLQFALQAWRSVFAEALHEAHAGETKVRQLDLARRTSARLWRLRNTSGSSLYAASFQAFVRLRDGAVQKRQITGEVCKLEKRYDKLKTWLEGHFSKTEANDHHSTLCLALQAWQQLCELSKRDVVMRSREFQTKQKIAMALKKACWRPLLPRIFGAWQIVCNRGRCQSLQKKHCRLFEQLESLLEHVDSLHCLNEVVITTTFTAWAHYGNVLKRRTRDPFPGSVSRMSFWERLLSKMTRDDECISAQETFQAWARGFSGERQQRAEQQCQQAVRNLEEQTAEAERKTQEHALQTERLEALVEECMRARRAAAASASPSAFALAQSPFCMKVADEKESIEPSSQGVARLREDEALPPLSPAPVSRVTETRPRENGEVDASSRAPGPREDGGSAPGLLVAPSELRILQEDRESGAASISLQTPPLDSRRTLERRGFASAPTLQVVPTAESRVSQEDRGAPLDCRRTREDRGFAPASASLEVGPSGSRKAPEDRGFVTASMSPEVSPFISNRNYNSDLVFHHHDTPTSHSSGADCGETVRAPRATTPPVSSVGLTFSTASRASSKSSRTPPPTSSPAAVSASASPSPSPPFPSPPFIMTPSGSARSFASPVRLSASQQVSQLSGATTPPSPSTASRRMAATESSAATCAGQLCFASPLGISSQAASAPRGPFAAAVASPAATSGQQPQSRQGVSGNSGHGSSGGSASGRGARIDVKGGGRSSAPNLATKPVATRSASIRESDGRQASRTPPPPLTSDQATPARAAEVAGRLAPAARRPAAPAAGSLVVSRLRS
eukprot:TRINITY_DN7133_c0_g1_i1.p1 TRINITY_DN7133_c0_g1~~TRINITY_DN7133_c0_g1_i1.p1  ORF type:complete len:902 (-),score=146.15 TRINITY_DN7133_c0_g1_i1:41-2746(-)